MRRLLCFAGLAGALILTAGCAGNQSDSTPTTVDMTELVTILPTPPGFDQTSSTITPAGAADVQATLAGVAKPSVAAEYEQLGFQSAAIRRWTGSSGARAVLVASRWKDHFTATNVGAGPSQLLAGTKGATAWTPSSLPGARGVRIAGPQPANVLSLAFEDVSLYMRTDGPVDPDRLVRTLDLAVERLRGGNTS